MTAIADLETRRSVWLGFSELYLDTDPAPAYASLARTLAASPYPLDELRRILFEEVHPVVRGNLLASAGVWNGFDPDWLCGRIAARQARPRWLRLPAGLLAATAKAAWRELEPRIARLRGVGSAFPQNTSK
jgi:hypothetical protein